MNQIRDYIEIVLWVAFQAIVLINLMGGAKLYWWDRRKILIIFQTGLATVMHAQISKLYRYDGFMGFDDHGIMFTNIIYSIAMILTFRYFYYQTQIKIIELLEYHDETLMNPRLHRSLGASLNFLRNLYFLSIVLVILDMYHHIIQYLDSSKIETTPYLAHTQSLLIESIFHILLIVYLSVLLRPRSNPGYNGLLIGA